MSHTKPRWAADERATPPVTSTKPHRNAQMSATYSHISDPVLKEQYEKVIAAGGRAGPAAEALLANRLDQDTVDWPKKDRPLTAQSVSGCSACLVAH